MSGLARCVHELGALLRRCVSSWRGEFRSRYCWSIARFESLAPHTVHTSTPRLFFTWALHSEEALELVRTISRRESISTRGSADEGRTALLTGLRKAPPSHVPVLLAVEKEDG